jgi:hypothetical protein
MPTFAFPASPALLTQYLRRSRNAPLPCNLNYIQSFGEVFDARLFSAQKRSTSELLRTL